MRSVCESRYKNIWYLSFSLWHADRLSPSSPRGRTENMTSVCGTDSWSVMLVTSSLMDPYSEIRPHWSLQRWDQRAVTQHYGPAGLWRTSFGVTWENVYLKKVFIFPMLFSKYQFSADVFKYLNMLYFVFYFDWYRFVFSKAGKLQKAVLTFCRFFSKPTGTILSSLRYQMISCSRFPSYIQSKSQICRIIFFSKILAVLSDACAGTAANFSPVFG